MNPEWDFFPPEAKSFTGRISVVKSIKTNYIFKQDLLCNNNRISLENQSIFRYWDYQ